MTSVRPWVQLTPLVLGEVPSPVAVRSVRRTELVAGFTPSDYSWRPSKIPIGKRPGRCLIRLSNNCCGLRTQVNNCLETIDSSRLSPDAVSLHACIYRIIHDAPLCIIAPVLICS
jgi:hypothetical protein